MFNFSIISGFVIGFIILIVFVTVVSLPYDQGKRDKEKEIFKEKYNKEINEAIKNLTDSERKEVLFIINEIIQEKKNKFKEKFQNLKWDNLFFLLRRLVYKDTRAVLLFVRSQARALTHAPHRLPLNLKSNFKNFDRFYFSFDRFFKFSFSFNIF